MMIKLDKLVFNSFQVNTYILYDDTGACMLVDPACYTEDEKQSLKNFVNDLGLMPVLHVNTHCHIDHMLGAHFVRGTWDLPFQAHGEEEALLKNGHIMGKVFGFNTKPMPSPDKTIAHGEIIAFGNSEIRALHVPGHSPGSIALYAENEGFVITGDALFSGGIGRTDLPGGNYDTLIKSIREQLFSLPGETQIHPGHGESSTIGREISTNPFF